MHVLRKLFATLLASDGRIYTRYGLQPFIESKLLDVVQPDIAQ